MKRTLYKVSVWDHDRNDWRAYVTRTRKWGLRKVLRTLYGYGYDRDLSILVERRAVTAPKV